MIRRLVLALVLTLLCASPLLAQLGPKDGRDLDPTDLERVKVGAPAPEFTLEDTPSLRHSNRIHNAGR